LVSAPSWAEPSYRSPGTMKQKARHGVMVIYRGLIIKIGYSWDMNEWHIE